ncbi:MAG: polymerase sigma-70 factor, subfamily [Solirubrobacterales bacterium]|nr:polymerase sigma-70 factor, subfamily [Solirubrobacterales bacterium]
MEAKQKSRAASARLIFVERLARPSEELEDLDTAGVVIAFQAGDRDAFGELYRRYFDRVYGYLRVLLKDRHAAEDGAQQIFTQIFEALPRYERRSQPFRAWLFTIVRNYAVDRLRRDNRIDVVDPEDLRRRQDEVAPENGETETLNWLTDSDLLLFVERLPVAQRQALLLRYMLGLSGAEVARVLERTPSDVRVLQSRALRFLRQRLTAVGRAPAVRRDRAGLQRRFRQAPVLRLRRFALGAGTGPAPRR